MADTILVCSGGGHLKQLFELAERIGIPPYQQLWMTFDNDLSRSLLADRRVEFVPFAAPRDLPNAIRIRKVAISLLREHIVDRAISTGSSPAVAVLPVALRSGAEVHYIESAARAIGPSLSGKILARNRRIETYTQYPSWASPRWRYRGSIFDRFAPGASTPRAEIRRVVVSVGTQEGYPFDRLYRALVPLLRGREVLWQTGDQDVERFGITGRPSVPHAELQAAIAEADVVVSHAGTGAALTALEAGKVPVLVPRLARYGEHVDDHQQQIAAELARRGLAIAPSPDELSLDSLEQAASGSVCEVTPPPFLLGGGHSVSQRAEGEVA